MGVTETVCVVVMMSGERGQFWLSQTQRSRVTKLIKSTKKERCAFAAIVSTTVRASSGSNPFATMSSTTRDRDSVGSSSYVRSCALRWAFRYCASAWLDRPSPRPMEMPSAIKLAEEG